MSKEEALTALMEANTARLQSVTRPALRDARAAVEGRISELLTKISLLLHEDAETTFAAKDVTDKLVQVTQASLLLGEAQDDPAMRPLARYFIEKHFRGKLDPRAAGQIIAAECEATTVNDEV